MNDWELLQAYLQQGSEAAFTALVERYVDLVYSAAYRQTNNSALAEDVTQAVFVVLARKAGRFSDQTILTGWLFRTTRHVALTALRSEQRRRRREQTAFAMMSQPAQADVWEEALPLLDELLARLADTDRNAVLLRFFQQKSLSEVGLALGVSEEAAKKRVARAVERLRKLFVGRGLVLSGTALGALLATGTVRSAPAGLAGRASSSALMKRSGIALSVGLLVEEALRRAGWAAARKVLEIAGAAVLCALVGTVAWQQLRTPPRPAPAGLAVAARTPPRAGQARAKVADAIVLPAAIPLRVLAADTARGFGKLPVHVEYSGRETSALDLLTDADGLCLIPLAGREFRSVTATARPAGYVPKEVGWFRYELESLSDLGEYELRLEPGRTLEGEIQDAEGQPVARAKLTVHVWARDLAEREHVVSSLAESDLDGRWRLDELPAGVADLWVTVEHADFAWLRTNVVISQPPGPPPKIVLQRGVSVAGSVSDETGIPLWGATVIGSDIPGSVSQNSSAVTGDDGLFYFARVNPGKLRLRAGAPGYAEGAKDLEVAADLDGVRFALRATPQTNAPSSDAGTETAIHLTGRVIDDETGMAVDRFKVLFGRESVLGKLEPAPEFWHPIGPALFLGEGHNGRFDWRWPPLDHPLLREFKLEVQASGYAPAVSPPTAVTTNGALPFEFRLKRSFRVAGQVLTANGSPAVGATVYLSGEDSVRAIQSGPDPERQTKTDPYGHFSLKPAAGTDRLVVLHDSGCGIVMFKQLNGRVVLQEWGRIEGQLRIGSSPGAAQVVSLEMARGAQDELRVPSVPRGIRTDGQGRFIFEKVPPGNYRAFRSVYLRPGGRGPYGLSHPTAVKVRPGATMMLSLGGSGRELRGQVRVLPDGVAADWNADLQILALRCAESAAGGTEDAARSPEFSGFQPGCPANYYFTVQPDGRFTIQDVPPGQYELRLRLTTRIVPQPPGNPDPDPRREIASTTVPVTVPEPSEQDGAGPIDLRAVSLQLRQQ